MQEADQLAIYPSTKRDQGFAGDCRQKNLASGRMEAMNPGPPE